MEVNSSWSRFHCQQTVSGFMDIAAGNSISMDHWRLQDAFKPYYASAKTPIEIISRSTLYVRRMLYISRQKKTIIQSNTDYQNLSDVWVRYTFYRADWVLNYMIRNYFYKEPLQVKIA